MSGALEPTTSVTKSAVVTAPTSIDAAGTQFGVNCAEATEPRITKAMTRGMRIANITEVSRGLNGRGDIVHPLGGGWLVSGQSGEIGTAKPRRTQDQEVAPARLERATLGFEGRTDGGLSRRFAVDATTI